MTGRLETVDGSNWREFVASPRAVLVIGKTDCPACAAWTAELDVLLATDPSLEDVRFGKMMVDRGGLIDFKRANTWLAEVDELPFTTIWERGDRVKSFAGGGADRLVRRLRARADQAST
jgi:hypothetical protein